MAVELDGRIVSAMQLQMAREMAAAMTYKQLAFDFALQGWQGFEKWALREEKEELTHACDFGYFLVERNVRPILNNVQLPPILISENPGDAFDAALRLEKLYWTYIEELYALAEDADDPDSCIMLRKKIEQQHESVAALVTITGKMHRAMGDAAALLQLDEHILEIK